MTTPTQQLAEIILGEPVGAWIGRKRQDGTSYRIIARELWQQTNGRVDVTHETVRAWERDAA